MKYRKQLGCLVMVLVALAACGGKGPQANKPSAQSTAILKKRLSEIAGQANGAAPADIDPDTRLDGARAGPGLRLTTMYTLVNSEANGVTSETFATKLTPVIKKASCENTELRPLINQGVVVVLEYHGSKGDPIGTVSIDRDTCVAPK